MSLLKLLFDLPDAGGQSLFTAEEQEELMAFENNLDEHLDENFSLQDNDGQFAFLHDESVPDAAPQDPMQGTSDRPVAVGDDKNQQGNNKDGVEGEGQPALGSIRIDDDPMSGHKSDNGPMTSVQPNGIPAEEPGTIQKYVVSQKHADSGHAMWLKVCVWLSPVELLHLNRGGAREREKERRESQMDESLVWSFPVGRYPFGIINGPGIEICCGLHWNIF